MGLKLQTRAPGHLSQSERGDLGRKESQVRRAALSVMFFFLSYKCCLISYFILHFLANKQTFYGILHAIKFTLFNCIISRF